MKTNIEFDWFRLLDISGPFLSTEALKKAFPHGLPKKDVDLFHDCRIALDEFQSDPEKLQSEWLRFVMAQLLNFSDTMVQSKSALGPELHIEVPETHDNLTPDFCVISPITHKPVLLIHVLPPETDLTRKFKDRRSNIQFESPHSRMVSLLHRTQPFTQTPDNDHAVGLVTNGLDWTLVYAPTGETPSLISWDARLWREEPETLQVLMDLINARRFFNLGADETIVKLFQKSAEAQEELTNQLGLQIRLAVEILVQEFARLDEDSDHTMLNGIAPERVYQAAVTVMMRLMFLLYAEERGLLPMDQSVYTTGYAASTIAEQLREQAAYNDEALLERHYDAWGRLLALFRAIHGGAFHENLQIPPYGGHLFDPDSFPFLEGRELGSNWRTDPAIPPGINNRVALHLLEAIQFIETVASNGFKERRKMSFRALDVEQIGYVYEGLLDHTARISDQFLVELEGNKGKNPEVSLTQLEAEYAKGMASFGKWYKGLTDKSEKSLARTLNRPLESFEEQALMQSCRQDSALYQRVMPFYGLLRRDALDKPLIFHPGQIYVTDGQDRRSSGAHYTPPSLTLPIVQYTLEPLVYVGPSEGKPRTDWVLKTPEELLKLKIADIACGSGAFLVQACRYLSERLQESWDQLEQLNPGAPITLYGATEMSATDQLLPQSLAERQMIAQRLVTEHCLYGVDKNPLAVEMAKLSLWLVTFDPTKPFTFLDHNIKCGDSLVGLSTLEQLEYFHPKGKVGRTIAPHIRDIANIRNTLNEINQLRSRLAKLPTFDITQAGEKQILLQQSEQKTHDLRHAADHMFAIILNYAGKSEKDLDQRLLYELDILQKSEDTLHFEALQIRFLHWPLEFPEVFAQGGFSAIVGNPPFMGGQKLTGAIGDEYREYLVHHLAEGQRGSADLCAYFFLRIADLLAIDGTTGLIATNTIAQGDTREVGLDQLVARGASIFRAVPSRKWPGTANLEVAHVWIRKGGWLGEFMLEDMQVSSITPYLTKPGRSSGNPYRLKANENKSFQGSIVLGMGFVLTPEGAQTLITKDPKNRDVLFPYLNGDDLNSRPDQLPSRWVINFRDWPLDRTAEGCWQTASEKERLAFRQSGHVPHDYSSPVAVDYPDCLEIIEEKVKPERDKNNRPQRRDRWWQYAERCPQLYAIIAGMERVFVHPFVSKYLSISHTNSKYIFAAPLAVFSLHGNDDLAFLCSCFHDLWIRKVCSTMGSTIRYAPTDCFETFPFPKSLSDLDEIGGRYSAHRQAIMTTRQEGLTTTYNRFHNPKEQSSDIQTLRELHVEMDNAVARAYGWSDLVLGHGFHTTKQGVRFTLSETARQEVLDRLLELNHQRYAEEVAAGLHDKAKKGSGKSTKPKPASGNSFKKSITEPEFVQSGLF